MSFSIYVLECVAMCVVFGVSVFGVLLVNPVSFIGDYPPEIQAQYYSSQHKEAAKEKMTFLTILRKVIAIIAFFHKIYGGKRSKNEKHDLRKAHVGSDDPHYVQVHK